MSQQKENFKREIGIRPLTLAIINSTIGTGIFVLPAIIAQSLGAASIIAYLVCGLLISLIALCYAEVGSKTEVSGGTYEYIEAAFGPFAGFIANNIYWFGACITADAAFINALADTLKYFFPFLSDELYRVIFFIIIFGGLTLLNIRSVKYGVRFMEIATVAKLFPLMFLVFAGVNFISTDNLKWTFTPSFHDISSASLILFFAFMGMEVPLSNGGEIKNPKRTVPVSILISIVLVLILYIALQMITQGVLGNTIAAHKDAPLAAVANVIVGKAGMTIVLITTAVSMLGIFSGDILCIPRILFAGARDGIMPKVLAKVHPKYFTPYVAIAAYAFLGFLMATFGGFTQLVILSSASLLLIYLGIVLATLKLRKTSQQNNQKTFRVPGGPIIPLLAIAVSIWLLSSLSKAEFIGIAIFIAGLSVVYFFIDMMKRKKVSSKI
ncbi:MAG: amino acid permease [Parafilimonas sp.]|nr:amino acid permease [Parafilimonas sp.]